MTFILPSFGASAIAAVPGGGGGGFSNAYSVDLDGSDDYVDCGGNADFSFTDGAGNDSAFSISAWVKLDIGTTARVAGKGNTEWLFGTNSSGQFSMILWSNDGISAFLQRYEPSVLSTGSWHNLVATYDGSNTSAGIKLYKAGSLISSTDDSVGTYAGMASQQGSLRLGQWEYNSTVMNGLIDEVAVFSSELSASDVTAIYNSGNGPTDISSLNPVGWWRMGDSDTGVSNGSSTPTIVSNVANSSAIENHYALDFDGSNDELTIPQGTFNLGTGNWTFSMWVNADTLSSDAGLFLIKGGANLIFSLWLTPTRFYCSNWYANTINASGTFNTNTWYHLVAVKYGLGTTDIHLYVDGSKITEGYHPSFSGNYGSDTQDAQLGNATNDGSSYPFDGKIDEFAFWNSALTASNITDIYNSGVPADLGSDGLDLNPTGWWRMGDGGTWNGSNWSIPDASANSNTATSANMVEADRVTDTPTANGILKNGPTYSNIVP